MDIVDTIEFPPVTPKELSDYWAQLGKYFKAVPSRPRPPVPRELRPPVVDTAPPPAPLTATPAQALASEPTQVAIHLESLTPDKSKAASLHTRSVIIQMLIRHQVLTETDVNEAVFRIVAEYPLNPIRHVPGERQINPFPMEEISEQVRQALK